jgi:lipoprotein-releasing system permease protein
MDLKDTEQLFDFQSGTRAIGIKIANVFEAREVDEEVRGLLSAQLYGTNNWIHLNQNLFTYMLIEKILMFLMLTLITLVAAFNLVGMLTMIIMEKRREIGVLKSMGASSRGVMTIFMLEGTFVGFLGTVGGMITGLVACFILDRINLPLPGDVYFIKTLPVLVDGWDLLLIAASAIFICFVATLYPSWEASKLLPVDAVKNE